MTERARSAGGTGRGSYARSEQTRARILDAALAEASALGFQKTSVARIAARAGVAVGVLNYHFGSRQELLAQLMAAQVEDFVSRLAAPGQEEDFFAYEERLLRTYLGYLRGNPAYARLGEEVRLHDPALYRQGVSASVQHICDRLRRGVQRGDLRPMGAAELRARAFFMLGTYTFIDRFVESGDYPGDAAAAGAFVGILRAGLAGPARSQDRTDHPPPNPFAR